MREQFPVPCRYSVVVPMHNEEGNVELLAQKLLAAMKGLDESFELIFVDDGSTDNTFPCLELLCASHPEICAVKLKRNFGQTPALVAGFDRAVGEVIIAMDGDLRSDPDDIRKLLQKLGEGYDVVNGWRHDRRHEGQLRTIPSRIANRFLATLSGIAIQDFGSSFKVYRREVIEGMRLYGEQHRYIPVIAAWQGARIAEVPVADLPRQFGKSHYGIGRVFQVPFDLLTLKFLRHYRTSPLRLFGLPGALNLFAGAIAYLYLGAAWFLKREPLASHAILAILGGVMLLGGIQLMGMGLLGELLALSRYGPQREPGYRVEKIVGREEISVTALPAQAKSMRAGV
jgi:glycosyltransferase involved in cell wall biosynthesis